MKKDLLHTPEGVRDIYSTECVEKKIIENKLHDVCRLYGYNDIQTPSIEYFDVFSKERGSVPSNEMFKLFDRYGNTLVLRPDMTPSIARAAAKYFEDHILPIKLCYVSNTFINVSKYYQGRLKENTVIGAELIDDASIDADYEIICMVIDCMKNAGLTEFQVELGNVAFFNGLLKDAGIKGDTYEELLNLINEKNYIGVEEILNNLNIDKNTAKVLLELPQLFGQAEVLDKARSLTNIPECIEAVDRLRDILRENGYENVRRFAPKFKDWNEDLKAKNGAKFLPAVPHKRKEEYLKEVSELVYLKCRPDKLTSQIYATFKNGQYNYLAEYALAGSAFFVAENSENTMFDKLRCKLKAEYKPYTGKGKKAQKQRDLQDCVQEVLCDLKQTARTREQSINTAKLLYQLADNAVRLSVEETLSTPIQEQTEDIDIVSEPEPCMEFG